MNKLNGLTKAELTENIDWNIETGIGIRIKSGHGRKAGAEVGTYHPQGYRRVYIKGKVLLVHRIIYFLKYGYCPKFIDHINQIKDDNGISNLRGATDQENQRNQGIQKNNKSGYKGVYLCKSSNKWIARITVNGKKIHLGYFNTALEASETYEARAKEEFGEFYNKPQED